MNRSAANTIELLLTHFDDQKPVLDSSLSSDVASGAPRPKERADLPSFRDDGGDPNSLPDQRWGLLVPQGPAGDRLLEIIAPLRKRREEQQGAKAIEFRAPPGMSDEDAMAWWDEEYGSDLIRDVDRPRYLLMLGDADLLSWELQQKLASDTFIGRLCFPSEEGYEAYIHKLLAFDRKPPMAGSRALYYTVRDGTAATNIGYAGLMTPTVEESRRGRDKGEFNAREIVEIGDGQCVSPDEFFAAAASPDPAMLFSISHGAGAPRAGWADAGEQRRFQGAMSFGGGLRITADDMASRSFLPGGLWFFFACFGAGTPSTSAYHHWLAALRDIGLYGRNIDAVLKSLPGENGRPFVAALPQAALANPDGPLAVMGHVDLAWTFSFQDVGTSNKYRSDARFQNIFRTIAEGKRVGAGYFNLQRFFNQASVDLTTLYNKEARDARARATGAEVTEDKAYKTRKATLWMLRQDLSAYVLLGDPAARLNIEGPWAEEDRKVRPVTGKDAPAKVPEVKMPPAAPKLDPTRVEEAVVAAPGSASASPPNLFLFEIAPTPGLAPGEIERRLLARTATFALASRPTLHAELFSHRILRAEGGGYAWEIAFEGIDLPNGEMDLDEAILCEVRAALAGVGEIRSTAAYINLSRPGPGLGFGRSTMDPSGPDSFGDDDLPGWEDYAEGAGTDNAGSALPDDLLAELKQNRAKIPAEPGLKPCHAGHMYAGGGDKSHLTYLSAYLANRAAKASPADRRKILAFRAFQSREGSTAAINTYDNQIVTWGTGWGGLGMLGKVMDRAVANEALRGAFGACGLRYRGKNVYDVVDVEAKKVLTGSREGLEAIRHSLPLLNLLIDVARGEATRDAATEAQIRTFMESSGNITGAEAIATQALFNLIAHLKHWAPGYVIGCLEWAVPQLGGGSPSEERDLRLAVLVGRYFYGKARKYKWIPDWKQFQLYWKHMKDDGLDCLSDPFIQASGPPAEDPFATTPIPEAAAAPKQASAVRAASEPVLKHAPLAGQPELESAASGKGSIHKGMKGEGVKALQQALIALGVEVPGGADGIFGPGLEGAVKALQQQLGLSADGVVGPGTLKAIDAKLGAPSQG
jgi:hypothetical protein